MVATLVASILFSMYFNDGIGGIPVVTHQKMRRDYPAPGDSAYASRLISHPESQR